MSLGKHLTRPDTRFEGSVVLDNGKRLVCVSTFDGEPESPAGKVERLNNLWSSLDVCCFAGFIRGLL